MNQQMLVNILGISPSDLEQVKSFFSSSNLNMIKKRLEDADTLLQILKVKADAALTLLKATRLSVDAHGAQLNAVGAVAKANAEKLDQILVSLNPTTTPE
jgi:hypothetical protein